MRVMGPAIGALVGALVVAAAAGGQPREPAGAPRWVRAFSAEPWIVNTSLTSDFGVRRDDKELSATLASVASVDTFHATLVVLEGRPDRQATLLALDAENGSIRWQKTNVTLHRWRAPASYSAMTRVGRSYYVEVVGSTVLVWATNGKSGGLGGCTDGPELVALSLKDGSRLWCNHQLGGQNVTLVPIAERDTLFAWAADDHVSLWGIDLRTGGVRWSETLPIDGSNWLRMISYSTALGSEDARVPLHHAGRVCLLIAEARRHGPVLRLPDEVVIRMLDVESGRRLWDVTTSLPGQGRGGRRWLSWMFSDALFIATTGKRVIAYDLASGRQLWSTSLEGVRRLRMVKGASREVVLVDFGSYPTFILGSESPNMRQTNGLAALDPATGEILWHDPKGRLLHRLEEASAALPVEAEDGVRVIDAATGREIRTLQPSFEHAVRYARVLQSGNIVVQSRSEVAVFESGSVQPTYRLSIPRARAHAGRLVWLVILGTLYPTYGLAALTVPSERASFAHGLHAPAMEAASESPVSFFVTGEGEDSHLVGVRIDSGALQDIGPFIWPRIQEFSLGNLLAQPHGFMYTIAKQKISAYSFDVDKAVHDAVHRSAALQSAVDARTRAIALVNQSQIEVAVREASGGVSALETLRTRTDLTSRERLVAERALADCHAVLADSAPDLDRVEHATRAVSAYERAIGLLERAREPGFEGWRADIEDRMARLRKALPRGHERDH